MDNILNIIVSALDLVLKDLAQHHERRLEIFGEPNCRKVRATTFCASRLGVLECTSFGISKSLCMYVFGLCGILGCRSYTPTDWFGVWVVLPVC